MAPIKAFWFDFMGTSLDWHSSIVAALPTELPESKRSIFAMEWRQAYFDENIKHLSEGKPVEDFDETQWRVLESTRLQLGLVKSAGLRYDMVFSSELLGFYKPSPEIYQKAMKLLKLNPDECVMVAAHTSDLKGAKAVGMKTVYAHRWTDDIKEDQETIRRENDGYLSDMHDLDDVIASF
ncbi:haloacid dehalogenase type II [Penicillium riverlandense]|uniref:haloacid dehalogenase type II n=1 Tax=Penicillium riverlandense TaxID=1903569 RepID=UPI0025480F4C|nr:haloacid dehalogenase type II [Penicillium riverlandense]KAJ5805369.1 haloacid dehalogenase type II [Penicillium riverlandense]